MQRVIHAALKRDHAACTAQVGNLIVTELAKGNVHEAFQHLKGWYRNTSETQAKPCFHTMERQTADIGTCQALSVARLTCPPIIINNAKRLKNIQDDTPADGKIRVAVAELTNGCSMGVSHMRVKHLKGWLKGAKLEEDLEKGPNNVGARKEWDVLIQLVQAVWEEGRIPTQLGWVVTVLIPKGGGDYRGICLFELIWKVIKRVIDQRLKAIALHNNLHGCCNGWGTGTTVIEAKLTQQLAYIEHAPFYGVFIDLKKAFDTMDRERCLLILEGHCAGPNMRRLIRHFCDEATNICRAS